MLPDEQLNGLLQEVKGVEPRPGFEQAAWSRIHAAEPLPASAWGRWVFPVAVAAGIMIGLGLGFLLPAARPDQGPQTMLVRNGSLTGAYLALISGGDHE